MSAMKSTMGRIKPQPGMARFDFKINMSRITPDQAKGLKHLDGSTIISKGYLSPKHASMVMAVLIKIREEESVEYARAKNQETEK